MENDKLLNPLVSICCVTYNHENYIRQCLDGFVMQKTTFPYEVLVHEDASTDRTANIIKEYEFKFPSLFRCVYQAENQFTKQNTLINILFPMCRGKYIALCEGDDFWTDQHKLQTQVEFLEFHSNYSGSAHQSIFIDRTDYLTGVPVSPIKTDTDINIKEILQIHPFQTASFVFRSSLIKSINPFPSEITSGDKALYLMCASAGDIRYFSIPMAAYRKSENGLSSNVTVEMMNKDLKMLPWLKRINNKFPKNLFLSNLHYTIFAYPGNSNPLNTKDYLLIKHYFLHLWYSLLCYPSSKNQIRIARKSLYYILRDKYTPFIKRYIVYKIFKKIKRKL